MTNEYFYLINQADPASSLENPAIIGRVRTFENGAHSYEAATRTGWRASDIVAKAVRRDNTSYVTVQVPTEEAVAAAAHRIANWDTLRAMQAGNRDVSATPEAGGRGL